jgi:acyl carrier protein
MASREALRVQVQAALAQVNVAVALAELSDAVTLDGDLGVDSYHLTEVARALEEAHGLAFTLVDWVVDQGETDAGYTVGSLLDYMLERTA